MQEIKGGEMDSGVGQKMRSEEKKKTNYKPSWRLKTVPPQQPSGTFI